jgi:hypothetical protein
MMNARPYSYAEKGQGPSGHNVRGLGKLLEFVPPMPHMATAHLSGLGQIDTTQVSTIGMTPGAISSSDLGFTDGLYQWTDPLSILSSLGSAFSTNFSFGLGVWSPIFLGVYLLMKHKR